MTLSTATPNDTLADLDQQARQYYELSLSDRVSNEHTAQYRGQARVIAQQLLDRQPDYSPALNLLGRIALDEGFYERAEHYLQFALNQAPEDASCWYSLGHVKLATGHYDDALAHFSRSLDLAPGETRAATSLVYTFARQGNVVQAFNGYRQLFKLHPDDAHIRAKLFDVSRHIQADSFQPALAEDVIRWLKLDKVDHDGLAPLTASLLRHKYRLDDPDSVVDLQDLARDDMLGLALNTLYFSHADLEDFLTQVRKQVLLNCLAQQFSDPALLRLAAAFVVQGMHNEHVWAQDDEEQSLLSALKDLLDTALSTPEPQPADLNSALLMYGMYEPLHLLKQSEQLSRIALNRWPSYVRPIIRRCVNELREEMTLALEIEQLTPISDTISREVRQQYEENPYPRWLHLGYNTPTNYGRALEAELEGFRAPQFFNMGTIRILIAGSGTGRHALHVARYFRNVEVTAIDLSARSLAYSRRMADRYGIHNIRFLQADILELDRLDERFHVIECSGVLHHMSDPENGLKALQRRLETNGLLKIGLYSKRARRIVSQAQQQIERLGYTARQADIRRFREHLLQKRLEGDYSALLKSRDFYSTSGCRDLLFHVQEHCYSPARIKAMLDQHSLKFLGFVLSPDARQAFLASVNNQRPALTNLSDWEAFEKTHPDTFAGMLQFYVQPND
ncbi:class I SAM-dependent methyltransferase [Saccharospirillum impatiens]|uniref:class I SAM-dependent methyltransferase n=1 Tax=Saccharospirillum impatiens TaxID=169438 RepID=UPI0004204B7B|nr:class I SAM-dependent methyltransferase [Saccharospirillum impatiens]